MAMWAPRPLRRGQLPAQQLRGVDLHHDLGVEVVPGVEVEIGVRVAGEAVTAGMAAAPVGVDGPLERHLRCRRDPADDRLRLDLVERHAGEAGGVEGAYDRVGKRQRQRPWRLGCSDTADCSNACSNPNTRTGICPALGRAGSGRRSGGCCADLVHVELAHLADQLSSRCSGSAPACWKTTTPSRIAMIVGIE